MLGHLPKDQQEQKQARSTLRAAWKLDAEEGIRKLEQYASWLEREWPSAAASLREGLAELFTANRLGLPQSLRRCLTTTNIIDSSHAGVKPLALIKQASANRSRAAGRKALINQDLCNRLENVDPPYEKFLWYGTW